MIPKSSHFPNQGWKIHISATIEDASCLLYNVSEFLINNKVAFKFVPSEHMLENKNSKSADRAYSGKFITVYPRDVEHFHWLLKELEHITSDFEEGPYILNDCQWKNSNVFYRFGGLKKMIKRIDGIDTLVIYDNEGNSLEDLRVPYYYVPEFVEKPDFIIENEQLNNEEFNKLNDFENFEALHFSNAGGVYKVNKGEKKFILKEGRRKAGLDGDRNDGFSRIKNEYRSLKRLQNINGIANIYEYFEIWKHNYILEEFIEGNTLQEYIASNYPFSYDEHEYKSYSNKCIVILEKLHKIIEEIHNLGLAVGDLSTNNILINDQLEVHIIDFEVSCDKNKKYKLLLGTPGMINVNSKNYEEADWYSFYKICRFMFLPISSIHELSPKIKNKHDKFIKNKFGDRIINYILQFEKYQYPNINFWPEAFNLYNSLEVPTTDIEIDKINDFILNSIRSLIKYCDTDNLNLIPGNIYANNNYLSKFNYAHGSFGVISALSKNNAIKNNEALEFWIETTLYIIREYKINSIEELGLYNGLSGIMNVLYELGYENEVYQYIKSVVSLIENEDLTVMSNISIYSGLTGIVLTLASYNDIFTDLNLSKVIDKITLTIINKFDQNISEKTELDMGLISGWSGAALFLWKWGELTKNNVMKKKTFEIIEYINNNYIVKIGKELTLKNNGKYSPYLSNGALGFKLLLLEIYKDDKNALPIDLLDYIEVISQEPPYTNTFDSGLMSGYSGFLIYENAKKNLLSNGKNMDEIVKNLNIYMLSDSDGNILFPGKFGLKCSMDIEEGISGLIMCLYDLGKNQWNSWLPLPKSNLKIFEI
ncbi:class III lanthionine synthetase LanKC [Mammaliicoccus stepanovicii]|nr:class III lanthionine synthetase LanKC [Mammaliicoccus stepanovicii]PNZ71807.1 hypothetical protein CD111_12095 [Mammaliicoccus stepanovicii]